MSHFIITIARDAGCGGKEIGKLVADLLHIKYYDREIVETVAKETGFSAYDIARVEEIFALSPEPSPEERESCEAMIQMQAEAIRRFAAEESCVFVGRCADHFLKDTGIPCLNIYLYAPKKVCAKSFMKTYGLDLAHADAMVQRVEEKRDNFYQYVTGHARNNPKDRQLMLDTSLLGIEGTARLIQEIAEMTF